MTKNTHQINQDLLLCEENIMARIMGLAEPWYVKEYRLDEHKKSITVDIDFRKGSEFHFDSTDVAETGDYKVFDTRTKIFRHFSYGQYPLYLKVRVPRIRTAAGTIRMLSLPWFGLVSGYTLEFEAHVLKIAKSMPVRSICSVLNLTPDKVWRISDVYVTLARQLEDYSDVVAIGLDETSVKKHHKYITLFVDLKKNEPS